MMNNNKTLDNMLWVFLTDVADILSNKLNITIKEALDFIYHSKTYKILEDPEAKMWYYSDVYLADFFEHEYKTGGFDENIGL